MSDHKTAISKFLTDSNSERVAHIQAAQRQRLISCESPPFSSSKFTISDPSRTLARCLQVKWQMFPNRRQAQTQNDRCGSLVSPSLFSSVPVESLIVLFSVVVSYFIIFNFSEAQANQCQITQSKGMATQIQLQVILAGNCIATGIL